MPYVRIEITDGATYEQKLQIYKETTEMLVRILNKKPEYTFVVIEDVDNKNWGHMGTSVAQIREAEAKARELLELRRRQAHRAGSMSSRIRASSASASSRLASGARSSRKRSSDCRSAGISSSPTA